MPIPSESGQLLRYLDEALSAARVDRAAVYARCGVTPAMLKSESLRTPLAARGLFFAAIAEVTGEADPGLLLARHVPVPTRFLPTYLLLSSASLREGWQRTARYLRLVSDALDGRLIEQGACVAALIESGPLHGPHGGHGELLLARGIQLVLEQITGGDFRLRGLRLRAARPRNAAAYRQLFGAPVTFGAPHSALVFERRLLDQPSRFHDPYLLRVHLAAADQALQDLGRADVVQALRGHLAASLEHGEPELEAIAQRLSLSPRQLRHQLKRAGTRFSAVLDDFREQLACNLLREPGRSLAQVTYLTGFSEQSAFQRAFKRWTGKTPQQWRGR